MPDLRQQLQQCFRGRVCLMGLGNVGWGDDGFGVRLAEAVKSARQDEGEDEPSPDCGLQCLIAGISPERMMGRVTEQEFDHVLLVDAVDFGGLPGSVIFLDSAQMSSRYPQISTHKVSLGLLAKWAESNGTTRAWLLGAQPASLRPGVALSPTLQTTLKVLTELVREASAGVHV